MSKKQMEENINMLGESPDLNGFEIDDNINVDVVKAETPAYKSSTVKAKTKDKTEKKELINCLRNEVITIRHIPKTTGLVTNPKHILYGGMAETATRTFVVPRLSSGMYVNVLTDSEKAFLEYAMGLEDNALSIYKRTDNFWDDSNPNGISTVRLHKQDNFLNLADPEDYIRYKILLANKDYIAPSLKKLQDSPKATYQFVIISEGEEVKTAKNNMSATMQAYKEFGKVEDDINTLRVIVETIESRPTSKDTKLEFLQTKINDLIQADSKLFLKVITDPYLSTKVLIKECTEAGLISNRGGFLYLRSDGSPLCEHGEDPTLSVAAKYLNNPKHQEIKFTLEAKLKQ